MLRATPALALVLLALSASPASAGPRWLRASWTGPSHTSFTVSWTDDAAGAGALEYRLPGGTSTSVSSTSSSTGTGELDVTYVATAEGLSPATQYEYRVQSGGAWSGWQPITTAPEPGACKPFLFVAGGDSRGENLPLVKTYNASSQWKDVARRMAADQPLFTLHTGDVVRDGDKAGQWEKEMPALEPLSRVAPFFLAIGNHDDGPGQGPGARYNSLFATPANGPDAVDDYYSFVVGNALVISLSSFTFNMNVQIDWMREVLEANAGKVDWRIAMFHTPIWSSGNHGSNEGNRMVAERLVPLLDEFGVDLVLVGHDHHYERFHPTRGGYGGVPRQVKPLSRDSERRGVAEGTVHLVTGGAGALVDPILDTRSPEAGSAFRSNRFHYAALEVNGATLSITVRNCGSQTSFDSSCSGVLDYVILEKPQSACAADGPDAGTPDAGTEPDAGEADAGTEPDAGEADAGTEPDAGEADAGEVADSGESDAGLVADGGPDAPDAGTGDNGGPGDDVTAPTGGCECSSFAAFPALALLSGLTLLLRRRRRV